MKRKCSNCIHRAFSSMFGVDYCLDYEMTTTENEEIKTAADCPRYEEGIPYCLTEEAKHENDRDEWDDYWRSR